MISDIPELLIAIGLVGAVAWAVYNWLRPHQEAPKLRARR